MISDILDHPESAELRADVAVIGSGLAGTEAARQLARAGRSVLLLESGRREFDPGIQALYDAQMVGKPHRQYDEDANFHRYLPPHYRGLNRIRQFGGTSHTWTGKWRAFTQRDLESRDWIPHSGWPLSEADLREHYLAVASDYGLGDVLQEIEHPRFTAGKQMLSAAGLHLSIHYWEARQTRVAERFGDELEASQQIHVVLGASATQLVLDETRKRVVAVHCACREGRRITAHADAVILATGGLEVPRLLLSSNRQVEAGIGNEYGLVGRYYIEHPKDQSTVLEPGPALATFATDLQSQPRPRFCLSFSLDDQTLAQHRLLRHSVYLTPCYERLREKAGRLLRGRSAIRDEIGMVHHYRVKFATEQVPQRESRVYLGQRRDALGMPELVIDWRFTDVDHRSLAESCRQLQHAFSRAGLGKLRFPAEPMTMEQTMDAAHPMGTARMADSPREGVVDRDCRVHGTDNLYVASSAVFPTGSVYSPTYTIVALANRLGKHLAGSLRAPTASVRIG
jgi:choline dehydrogenase-like flavoprotein